MRAPSYHDDWPTDVKLVYANDVREMWDPAAAPHVWHQYHNQLDLYLSFCPFPPPLAILDVGCAQATLALLLAERGHRVTAVDIRPQFLEYARSRHEHGKIEFVAANAMELYLDRTFDMVFANQILEHTVYPDNLVQRLVAHLRPGGRLVVTTPNREYFANRRAGLPSYSDLGNPALHESRQFTADGDGHFFAYTRAELWGILARAGLLEITLQQFETPWISGHAKIRHLQPFLPVSLLRRLDAITRRLPGLGAALTHQLLGTGVVSE